MREKAQDYSDKVRSKAQKNAGTKRVHSPEDKSASCSQELKQVPSPADRALPPVAGTTVSYTSTLSPYMVTSPRVPRTSSPNPMRQVSNLPESSLLSNDEEWCSRHHVTWSQGNTVLPRTRRTYFDPLPQVGVLAGSYAAVPVFFPDSGQDTHMCKMQRRWQKRHYPFKRPGAAMRAALYPNSTWSSCSQHSTGYVNNAEEQALTTLPSLSEGKDGQVQEDDDQYGKQPSLGTQSSSMTKSGSFHHSKSWGRRRRSSANSQPRKSFFKKKTAMASSSAVLAQFVDWCHEKYGHLVRVFLMLDKSRTMKLSKVEFKMGLHGLNYKHNLDHLWQLLDRDQSGWVSFLHFAAEDAVVLAHFKHWADTKFGSVAAAFKALDSSRDGKLSYSEFSNGLKRLGFTTFVNTCLRTLFDLIDDPGDETSKRCITVEEIAFLDVWECPEYLWSAPDHAAKEKFLESIITRYHKNPLLAWRKALDTDSSMRVSYYEFLKAYRLMSQNSLLPASNSVPELFRALDISNTGWLSLRDFDEPTYHSLIRFSKWATEAFGKVHLLCKNLAGAEDEGKVKFKIFRKVMKEALGLDNDEAWKLFEGLSMESKKSGAIAPDELFFLDRWDYKAEYEEELAWEKMMTDIGKELHGEPAISEIEAQQTQEGPGETEPIAG